VAIFPIFLKEIGMFMWILILDNLFEKDQTNEKEIFSSHVESLKIESEMKLFFFK
jgi:hypothetical protein